MEKEGMIAASENVSSKHNPVIQPLYPSATCNSSVFQIGLKDSEVKIKTCYSCQTQIDEEYIMRVANLSWHANCLRCIKCDVQLIKNCFFKQGHLYCGIDYQKEFAMRCSGCHDILNNAELVQRAGCRFYHPRCFHCVICEQQLNKGDKFYLLSETGSLVCTLDYETNKFRDLENVNKRPRTTISSQQLEALKVAYKESSKPARHIRERLSVQTGLDMRVVQVWFQNRRAKERRLSKDSKGESVYTYDHMLDGMPVMPPRSSMWPFQMSFSTETYSHCVSHD